MATHRYIISSGHRNTDRGGAHREAEWTYPISVKLKNAIHRRGGKAWIIQEEDGDSDPSFCVGRGLQNAARLCVDLANAVGGVDAYISMHYEGGPAGGFFGIFPDARSGVDIGSNNTMDRRLCRIFAKHVEKTGMPKRLAGVVEPGVMSERQTGVGGQGWRLGEFVGTLGFRTTTARVILEAGNYGTIADRNRIWNDAWQDRYVEALVDGLEEEYGKFSGKPTPAPKPEPTTPYVPGASVAATDRLNVRTGYSTQYSVVHVLDVGERAEVIADSEGRSVTFNDGREWVNIASEFGSGWAASEWLEPVGKPEPAPEPTLDTFTTRYELPFRRDDYGFNGVVTATLPVGTTGKIISGPEMRDGIGWYRADVNGHGTGWVPASILRTLDIVDGDTAKDVD